MRSLLLSAALGLGVLGFAAATPSQAKAYWPLGMTYNYQVGPYAVGGGYVGAPYYRFSTGPGRYNVMYGYPGYYRTYNNPMGFGAVYTSPGYTGTAFSPVMGAYNYYATPGYMGYSYNRFSGYRQFVIPGLTYATPAGYGSGMVGGGY
jgi:hypothetical protein